MTITQDTYNRLHSACPKCREKFKGASTYACYIISDMTSRDSNKISCSCGFEGIVHDLVPLVDDQPFSDLLDALERARLLAAGDIKGLSPAGRASTILATEINVMTGLLMGYMTGKYTDTEPISDYLLYRGLLIKDDKGIRLV
jgi:hypothetical protein